MCAQLFYTDARDKAVSFTELSSMVTRVLDQMGMEYKHKVHLFRKMMTVEMLSMHSIPMELVRRVGLWGSFETAITTYASVLPKKLVLQLAGGGSRDPEADYGPFRLDLYNEYEAGRGYGWMKEIVMTNPLSAFKRRQNLMTVRVHG